MNPYPILPGQESPARLLLRLPMAEKSVTTELSHDFTLPDYLPEIRKMLRVTASVLPAESYVGGGNASFHGELTYTVLYTGADGKLWSSELPAEYEYSVPLDAPSSFDLSLGVTAWCTNVPELLVTRVTSQRKLSVRCKMRSDVRVYGWQSLEEKLLGSAPRGKIERLTGEADSAAILTETGTVKVNDEILTDAESEMRVICSDGRVFITEANADKDRVTLRGELHLKLLAEKEGSAEAPVRLIRKIPFSTDLEIEGADRTFACRGFGDVAALQCTVEEGRILADVELCVTAECQKNTRVSFVKDLFATKCATEPVYREVNFPFAVRCFSGNFTFSSAISLTDLHLTEADNIFDVTGEFSPEKVECTGDKLVYTGTCHLHVLALHAESNEYGFAEASLPFRYTTDADVPEGMALPPVTDSDARFEAFSFRAKHDGEKLSVDAEVGVSLRCAGKIPVRYLEAASFGEAYPSSQGDVVLYYPPKGETLWEAARKYHVSPNELMEQNSLDLSAEDLLSGVKYLALEG